MKKKRHIPCIVVLDTMWGEGGEAPPFFHINPHTHSGKRLYQLLGDQRFLVTNCCCVQTNHATKHGIPDPAWLFENLQHYTCDKLLICGKVAQETFWSLCFDSRSLILGKRPTKLFQLPHPASRNWTKAKITEWKERLA